METTELRKVKRGDFFKRTETAKTVFIRGEYDRESKRFSCIDFDDMNREIYLKANTRVFVGFDF